MSQGSNAGRVALPPCAALVFLALASFVLSAPRLRFLGAEDGGLSDAGMAVGLEKKGWLWSSTPPDSMLHMVRAAARLSILLLVSIWRPDSSESEPESVSELAGPASEVSILAADALEALLGARRFAAPLLRRRRRVEQYGQLPSLCCITMSRQTRQQRVWQQYVATGCSSRLRHTGQNWWASLTIWTGAAWWAAAGAAEVSMVAAEEKPKRASFQAVVEA